MVASSIGDVSKSAFGTSATLTGILWALSPEVSEGPQPDGEVRVCYYISVDISHVKVPTEVWQDGRASQT